MCVRRGVLSSHRQRGGNEALIPRLRRVSFAMANYLPTSFIWMNFTRFRCVFPVHWWWQESSGSPMLGLAESGGIGCNGSDGGGGVISGWTSHNLNMLRSKSSDWAWAIAVLPFIFIVSVLSISGANSYVWRVHCVPPRFIRIHEPLWISVDTEVSMHKRPWSSETKTSRPRPIWVVAMMFLLILEPSIYLGLVNYLQHGEKFLRRASRTFFFWSIDQHLLVLLISFLQKLPQQIPATLVQVVSHLFFLWWKKHVITHPRQSQWSLTAKMICSWYGKWSSIARTCGLWWANGVTSSWIKSLWMRRSWTGILSWIHFYFEQKNLCTPRPYSQAYDCFTALLWSTFTSLPSVTQVSLRNASEHLNVVNRLIASFRRGWRMASFRHSKRNRTEIKNGRYLATMERFRNHTKQNHQLIPLVTCERTFRWNSLRSVG